VANANMLFAQVVKNRKEENVISVIKDISCLKLVFAQSVSPNTMPAWIVKTTRYVRSAKRDLL
jgi:hypothetical protein